MSLDTIFFYGTRGKKLLCKCEACGKTVAIALPLTAAEIEDYKNVFVKHHETCTSAASARRAK